MSSVFSTVSSVTFSGVNKLSQLLSLIVFNDSSSIRKVGQDFSLKKIMKLALRIMSMKSLEQQDQVLLTWLQSTLSTSILSQVLGSAHSYEVREQIHEYFHK